MLVSPPIHLQRWIDDNSKSFLPPICNKLLYKGRLSIMLVGGPNERSDFHSEEGSEFFWQLKGLLNVVTIQNEKQVPVAINEGYAYLLPSRVRHSPRRSAKSIGLVIERERIEGELDSLSWYTSNESSTSLLWEKYFICNDLGKDLVPVVEEFLKTEQAKTGKPLGFKPSGIHIPLVKTVPEPIKMNDFIEKVKKDGNDLKIFENHPDKEFEIFIDGSKRKQFKQYVEIFFYQISGQAFINDDIELKEGECCVFTFNSDNDIVHVARSELSVGLVVALKNPFGNKIISSKI